MSNIADDPSYWLGRAREVREMMKGVSDEEMREIIEEIADGYERIAERITRQQHNQIKR
jgi:hypothetical protein